MVRRKRMKACQDQVKLVKGVTYTMLRRVRVGKKVGTTLDDTWRGARTTPGYLFSPTSSVVVFFFKGSARSTLCITDR